MDEYGRHLRDFEVLKNDYESRSKEHKLSNNNKDRRKKKKRKFIKALSSSLTLVYIAPLIIAGGNMEHKVALTENKETTHIEAAIKKDTIINDNEDTSDIEDIKEEIEEIIYISCDECYGSGIICPGDPDFGYDRGNGEGYEGCFGKGFSTCPDIWCNEGVKTCQSCKGLGLDRHGDNCEVCGGQGITDCEFCHNTGIAECITMSSHYKCAKCDGTGKLTIIKE